MKEPSRKSIAVKVRNREKTIFEGEVKAVSSENDKGVFDVLPRHANFISIIKNRIVLHGQRREKRKIQIKSGILKVWENQVSIYLDILSPIASS